MKQFYVTGLREGAKVEDVFLVVQKSVASTRTGSRYLKLKLADKTGEIDAVKWDASESDISRTGEGEYVLVHGTVITYRDSPQLTLDSVQRWGQAIEPSDFIRCTEKDIDEMMAELASFLARVKNPQLKALLDYFFSDQAFSDTFRQAPAAKRIHHAFIGGLLEHTLSVVKTCASLAELYPQVNADLLLVGAALHDIGKVGEFTWSGAINYSSEGHLVGHLVSGAMMVRNAAESIDGFDPLLSLALQHLVLAHHGFKDFGSPIEPKSIEAVMLHCADDLDAKVSIFEQAIAESDDNGETGLFTKRHYLLDRPIFKGIPQLEVREDALTSDASSSEIPDLELFAATEDYDPFADE